MAAQDFEKAGIIEGDFYSIAWRILDSQHFGVPQRRRRIFVVGHLGKDWRPPVAVLFEQDSLRGNIAPGGKKRKGST
ncbi:DNA (cytosine-5-)-methyltransferase, partial [Streptococcus pneumoniae]|nr:DNA (cytosine-5-)-methyltransferase [Streptococcus pneumoniae]